MLSLSLSAAALRRFGLTLSAFAVLFTVWSIVPPDAAHGCSCMQPGSPIGELEQASTVFRGTVTSVREYQNLFSNIISSTDPTTVEFDVATVWKGDLPAAASFTTARLGGSCGFEFVEGQEYVVYSRDGSTVNLCSRTMEIERATEDLLALGPGRPPGAGPASEAGKDSDVEPLGGGCTAAADGSASPLDAAWLWAMVGLAVLGVRRRRDR